MHSHLQMNGWCSVAKSCLTLQPHELQHARLLCPPLSHGVYSNLCPLSQWCYLTVSSSATCFSFCLQSFPASGSFTIRWLKSWSFSFSISISPSNEHSGLISFKIDWFHLLAVQGTLRSLLQHHSLKASVLWLSAFFIVQLSRLYMTTGKTTALTIWTFLSQVMSLLFNILPRFVIAFLPRRNASFNFMAAVTICSDFGAQENKICHCFHFSPFYLRWLD